MSIRLYTLKMSSARVLKYSSLSLAILCLAAWCLTLRFTLGASKGSMGICLHEGRVYGGYWRGAMHLTVYPHDWPTIFPQTGIFRGLDEPHMRWGFDFYFKPGAYVAYIPLWCPFLLSTLTFAALASRRVRPLGTCPKCGYDTTGLTQCPECGTAHLTPEVQAIAGSSASARLVP